MGDFHFKTKLDQTLLLGVKASTIRQLLDGILAVPESSIYHHTHRYLQQHRRLSPEPPNDFAYWVGSVLGDAPLAEAIASVDIVGFDSLAALRGALADAIREGRKPGGRPRSSPAGSEFHFLASRIFVLDTPHRASTPGEFAAVLGKISVSALYYHIFDAKLRLGKGENDFSRWFLDSGRGELAGRIARLDPYSYTLEGLRQEIIALVERHGGN